MNETVCPICGKPIVALYEVQDHAACQPPPAPRPSDWELQKRFNRLARRLERLGVNAYRVGSQQGNPHVLSRR